MKTTQKMLALAVSVTVLSSGAFAAMFTDTSGNWAQADIQALSQQNIIGGYPDGSFRPDGLITRAEFAAILVKALGLQTQAGMQSSFYDVPGNFWAEPAIETVKAQGLVSGYPGNLFKPNNNITRAEALAMLANAERTMPNPDPQAEQSLLGQFYDNNQVPGWARDAVAKTVATGVFKNRPSSPGTIEPNRLVTRAEVAAMVDGLRVALGNPGAAGTMAQNTQQQNEAYNNNSAYNNNGQMLQGHVAVVPANTEFTGTLQQGLDSSNARVGDQVTLTLDQPLASQNNMIVAPVGSQVIGHVATVKPAGHAGGYGSLDVQFDQVVLPDGQRYEISATVNTPDGILHGDTTKGRILKAAGKTALGAGLGALAGTALGPLSGGKVGKGAIYGTAIGAGAGLVTAAVQKGKEVSLDPGDRLQVILKAPLSVTVQQ